ncbi:hypothetical protein CEXT_195851 [Caerostris extrusa]|uniref:Uncharacterized protein n=1 Tax=Caerostris extrusa TaxID=172846 RepID=A0AAV4XBA5_CAEEX|nr:hypothetical protein CEXT_195851 [Caerostris extrusa]
MNTSTGSGVWSAATSFRVNKRTGGWGVGWRKLILQVGGTEGSQVRMMCPERVRDAEFHPFLVGGMPKDRAIPHALHVCTSLLGSSYNVVATSSTDVETTDFLPLPDFTAKDPSLRIY